MITKVTSKGPVEVTVLIPSLKFQRACTFQTWEMQTGSLILDTYVTTTVAYTYNNINAKSKVISSLYV